MVLRRIERYGERWIISAHVFMASFRLFVCVRVFAYMCICRPMFRSHAMLGFWMAVGGSEIRPNLQRHSLYSVLRCSFNFQLGGAK